MNEAMKKLYRRLGGSVIMASLLLPGAATQSAVAPGDVWLGAPFSGKLHSQDQCGSTSNTCPFPWKHWTAFGGNWSIDLPKETGSGVYLYLAPQYSRDSVVAKVESVREACTSGRAGGSVVRVGVYLNDKRVGTVAYAHIANPSKVGTINRWGGKIGTIFTTTKTNSLCWTGPHLHLEVASEQGFSCYNKGLVPSLKLNETNFIGFVTGNRASKARQACP